MNIKGIFKKVSILLSLLFVITVVTACGSKDNDAESEDGVTEVSFIAYSNYEAPLQAVVEKFEAENKDIKIKLELAPFSQLMETIEIKMGSKSKDVDLLFVDTPLTMNYVLRGFLEPLDDLMDINPSEVWADSAVDAVTFENELVAAPLNSSSQVMYLNKDIFEEKGVEIPKEDERLTWEEVVELAKQLTYDSTGDGQTDVFGFSFDQIDRAYQLLALSDSKGVEMISDDGLTANGYTNSKESVEAYEFYYDLYNTHKISPKIDREEAIDYFISGKIAMYVGANHNLPKLEDSDLNYGVSLHPYFEGEKVATPTGAWNAGISKYSENKEEAARFLEYLTTDPEGSKAFFEVGATLPVNLELLDYIIEDKKYDEFPNSVIRIAAIESRETAVTRPKTPGYLEWETNMNRAFENIKNGTKPQEALDNAAKEIDNLLKKYAQ